MSFAKEVTPPCILPDNRFGTAPEYAMTWLLPGYLPVGSNIGQHRDHSIPMYELIEPGDGIFRHMAFLNLEGVDPAHGYGLYVNCPVFPLAEIIMDHSSYSVLFS